MSVEELRDREKELEAQKRGLERQAQAADDGLNIERIDQELLDIRNQIRAMAAELLADDVRNAALAENYFIGKQRFSKRPAVDNPLDGTSAQTEAQLRIEIDRALEQVTPLQREALYLMLRGWTNIEIAAVYGVSEPNISYRVRKTKNIIMNKVEQAMAGRRLLAGGLVLDMRDTAVMKAVLAAMTPRQAAYFYLYYSEALSHSEISALRGRRNSASTGHDTISRALRNIDILLDGQDVVLDHPEALDEVGYKTYCELRTHPELVRISGSLPSPKRYFSKGRGPMSAAYRTPHRWTVQTQVWRRDGPAWRAPGNTPAVPPGRLRAALIADGKDIFQELETVFSVCRYIFEQRKTSNS